MQIIESGEVFDVVVVGSGATGGWMAKHLSEAGLKVALLEAGPNVTPADYTEHLQPYDLKYRNFSPEVARNRPIQSMKGACEESNYHWFVDDIQNPYTYPEGRKYQWTRGRMLGGRSLTWGRQSYRFSPMDLAPASRDGFGEDWPVTYEELVPYYEKVERYVGISGSAEGLPQIPDSIMQPPMGMNCGEKHFQQRVEKAMPKQRVFIGRAAVMTQDLNGRKACHYCGPCDHGCITGSYFASNWTTLPDAVKTGNCTIITDAVVSHIETDRNTGLARGVAYIDRLTRQPREIRAKAVTLCASTLESTRILLNSGEGFCNSSGALGRYLMDHVTANTSSRLPVKEHAVWAGAPSRPNGLYIPRALNLDRPHTNGMIRGYGYQARHAIRYDNVSAIAARPGFGAAFKKGVHSLDTYVFTLDSYNECLPRWENQATIDPHVRDAWGIPALHINATWSDNEMKLWHHSIAMAEEMHRAAGAEDIRLPKEPTLPGGKTHEVGTARMGKDPKKSVLNEFNQAHDVKNIYCTDGAAFVSVACQNPTLTMMALTVRAGDHIIERAKRGDL